MFGVEPNPRSIDLVLLREPFERLELWLTSTDRAFLLCLLRLRQTDPCPESLLFCLKRLSNPNFRLMEEVLDVSDPV